MRTFILLALALALALVIGLPTPATAAPLPQPAPCATAAAAALSQQGAAYVWGAKGPTTFDCSGLMYWAWQQAGYDIGISTYDQVRAGVQIPCSLSDLAGVNTQCWEAGDLIFLRYSKGQHVAMYIGNGLFADAYNTNTGVIIHNPAEDSFYWNNYWQSRRIIDCDGVILNPETPYNQILVTSPDLEDLPDLLGSVSYTVPQCGACNPDGSTILPATDWDGQWPSGTDLLNVGYVMQMVISWLAWRISELLRILICWLLNMLAMLADLLISLINTLVDGLNGVWKLLLWMWFGIQSWLGALYYLLADVADVLGMLLPLINLIIAMIIDLLELVGEVIRAILSLLGLIISSVLGLLGWVGGIGIGLWLVFWGGISGSSIPPQLQQTSILYQIVRGAGEGWRDSPAGWILVLLWALAYVWFVVWMSRFFSASSTTGE